MIRYAFHTSATFGRRRQSGAPSFRASRRKGTVAYLVAIVIPVFLVFVGFLINITYLDLVRTDLRIATDAAAHAAAHVLITTGSRDQAVAAAQDAAARNTVAGQTLTLSSSDLEFGHTIRTRQSARYHFSAGDTHCNAVRVTGSRASDSADGPVPLIFPAIVGKNQFEPVVSTVAAQMERQIVVVLDQSGSLHDTLPQNNDTPDDPPLIPRQAAVHDALIAFQHTLAATPSNEALALVTFFQTPELLVPLTNDYTTFDEQLARLPDENQSTQGYAPTAIDLAHKVLTEHRAHDPFAAQVIVLVTDGYDFAESQMEQAVRLAVSAGQVVYVVTLGPDADMISAKRISHLGLGQHYHANTSVELVDALQQIAEQSPTVIAQ